MIILHIITTNAVKADKENKMSKSIEDRVDEKVLKEFRVFRVEYLNGQYEVYEYSKIHGAYLFYGYYSSKKELMELPCR